MTFVASWWPFGPFSALFSQVTEKYRENVEKESKMKTEALEPRRLSAFSTKKMIKVSFSRFAKVGRL